MARPSSQGPFRALDANGLPLAGGKLYAYEAGTSTAKSTYTDSTLATPNTNPVILDPSGYANVWFASGAYKLILKTSADATLWTMDNIPGNEDPVFVSSIVALSTTTAINSVYETALLVCSGTITLNLVAAATAGANFYFIVRNDGTGVITIDPNSTETINGATTVTLNPGESVTVICTGTLWYSLFRGVPRSGAVAATAASIKLAEATNNGTSEITLKAPDSLAADAIIVLPDAAGTLLGTDKAVTVTQGGTNATTAAGARTNLGLGTAATQNTGTSGATVPLLNGANTASAVQTISLANATNLIIENTTAAAAVYAQFKTNGASDGYVGASPTNCIEVLDSTGGNTRFRVTNAGQGLFGAGLAGSSTNDNATAGSVGEYAISYARTQSSAVTITIASPAVITYTTHGFVGTAPELDCAPVVFTNSGGALPTGITAGTVYYIVPSSITTNTFQIATSVANALAGTSVNTSGSQSGTHTCTAGLALTSGAVGNVTGISLTAGDWDVTGLVNYLTAASTSATQFLSSITSTSVTADNTGAYSRIPMAAIVPGSGTFFTFPLNRVRFSLSSTTTIYLVALSTFTVSTMTAWGHIDARRVR